MSRATLNEKLSLRRQPNPETAWNLRNWPTGFTDGETNRLFVAVELAWRGYFTFTDALFNPRDHAVPYSILFNTKTWTPIRPIEARRFRGFTYNVPSLTSP
jgi:hypothetical protein